MPSADIVFDTLFAYQRSAALKSAIDLDLFTAIDEGARTVSAIANRCQASDRGTRILCDYLSTIGLLKKSDGRYDLQPESATFLSKRSPAYLGTTTRFLSRPELKRDFENLTDAVRRGGIPSSGESLVAAENLIWVEFARSMMPMMRPAAQAIADLVASPGETVRVLDIAAGHGLFGVTIAQRSPRAEVIAVDWKPVLAVAEENARAAGVADRFRALPGDAFTVDFGDRYDIALVTNFLHHFDEPTCTTFLRKVHKALRPGGRVVVLEFVPNADRVSPPVPARFSLTMLAETTGGDAYTFDELRRQLENAGFSHVTAHELPTPQMVLLAGK
jgi:ubiquinone/menaquinone biosynthesis C-methylase UbiE